MLMTEEFLGFLFFYFSLMTSAFIALGGGGGTIDLPRILKEKNKRTNRWINSQSINKSTRRLPNSTVGF